MSTLPPSAVEDRPVLPSVRRVSTALLAALLGIGCPSPERAGGFCEADTECGEGRACAAGACVACPPCADGEACVGGLCLPALCRDVACRPGQGCVNGRSLTGAWMPRSHSRAIDEDLNQGHPAKRKTAQTSGG